MLNFLLLALLDDPRREAVDILAVAGQTTGVPLFATPLGVKFLAIVVLLAIATIAALVTGGVITLGHKSWKVALATAGSAFGGTFAIGFAIIIYLMP